MSGFSPAWLALREPADRAARNRDVIARCALTFAARSSLKVCDLGAGTGAAMRAFADLLPGEQQWTLVDRDPENLAGALTALEAWADKALRHDAGLTLHHGLRRIEVRTEVLDLARDPACWPMDSDLVTASALFDLTSAAWIKRLVAALAAGRRPLLATLTADEKIAASPPHPLDKKVAAAFRQHQSRDKGFGPSAGADAGRFLEQTLEAAGYALTAGESPWVLEPSELLQATVEGMAAAAAEIGVAGDELAAWLEHQRENTKQLIVGHRDVFARIL